jgi:hypothetical protein
LTITRTGNHGADRELDVEIAAHDLLPSLVEAIAAATAQCSDNVAVGITGAELGTDAERLKAQPP